MEFGDNLVGDGEARALGVPSLYPRTPASAPAPPRVTVTVALRPRRSSADTREGCETTRMV